MTTVRALTHLVAALLLCGCATQSEKSLVTTHHAKESSDVFCSPSDGQSFTVDRSANVLGQVKTQRTGEPVVGATVRVVDEEVSTITSWCGYFQLRLPAGKHRLMFRFVGFPDVVTDEFHVPQADSSVVLNVYMGPLLIE